MAQILQRKPNAARPERLWAVHRRQAATVSQATTLKSTERNPSRRIHWRLSNLSSFMYELPGCPSAAGGETLVPPNWNLSGIIPSELFIVHEGDIF